MAAVLADTRLTIVVRGTERRVRVVLLNLSTSKQTPVDTDQWGWAITQFPAGRYRVTVQRSGRTVGHSREIVLVAPKTTLYVSADAAI